MRNYLAKRTLQYVNSIRVDEGYPPLDQLKPGWRGVGDQCVVARSTNGYASHSWVSTYRGYYWHPLSVKAFISLFDFGAYRELETEDPIEQEERWQPAGEMLPDAYQASTLEERVQVPSPA